MRLGIFIDGTFMPERDGASARFAQMPSALVQSGTQIVVFHCYRGWSDLAQIAQAPFRTYLFPPEVFYGDLDGLSTVVREAGVTTIQMNDAETVCRIGYPLAEALNLKIVYEAHYHTSTLAKSLGATVSKIAALQELESDICRRIDHLIVFTEADRCRWMSLSHCPNDRISVVPFGVSTVSAPVENGRNGLVFLGNGFYEPNRRAVRRIVKEWLPRIRSRRPNTAVIVVGDMPDELKKLCRQEGIHVLGEVVDPIPLLVKAQVGIAPVTEGSGVRAKILTYLSAGLPVVATSAAAEGLDFPAVFVEDVASSAAERCVDILQDRAKYRAAVMQTNALLNSDFLWPDIARGATGIYNTIMRRDRRIGPTEKRMECARLPMWIQEVLAKGRFTDCKATGMGNVTMAIAEHGRITQRI